MPKPPKYPDMSEQALADLNTRIQGLRALSLPVSQVLPYARNSRTHTDAQIAGICASFTEFGVLAPLIVDDLYMVLAGHARLQAAKKLGLSHVPCIILKGLSVSQKKAYVIADNRIAMNSDWDATLLRTELAALKAMEFDMPVLGFTESELDAALTANDLPLPQEGQAGQAGTGQEQAKETCTCPNCKSVFEKQKK